MYLKSLTLKGFKSFASSTTLEFEPGITCVVGPNGSGKSNVVDALSWVMGEQGAKALRGGKMEDVIFSGTVNKAPLGRAEVILTIDNTDGALPIEYTEVTISRIMFRNGGSEYAINGEPCRLLDIQELLSDSGIGREMHVIVGQGQLDTILRATPDDRRGFIEEAAGVLKHRKRKEKALRKLDAMQANLLRLTDLTAELRRQLTPLGKQAEVARRAQVIQLDVRDSKSRLMADDLVQLRNALAAEVADETALREKRSHVENEIASLQAREASLDAELKSAAPLIAKKQETWYRLSSLRERFHGTASLARDRVRVLTPELEETVGRDPEELEREAQAARAEAQQLSVEVTEHRRSLEVATAERATAEAAHAAEVQRVVEFERAVNDRRDGMTRLVGQVDAAKQRIETRTTEIGRLESQIAEAIQRAETAQRDFQAREGDIVGLSDGELGLDAAYETAESAAAAAHDALAALQSELVALTAENNTLTARIETLKLTLQRQTGSQTLLQSASQMTGISGSIAEIISVQAGYETAIAAALGNNAEAVAVADIESALAAFEVLKQDGAGRADVIIATDRSAARPTLSLPAGVVWALDVIAGPSDVVNALSYVLAHTVIVDDVRTAQQLVRDHVELTAVSRGGDVLTTFRGSGGTEAGPGLIELQATLAEAVERIKQVELRSSELAFEVRQAEIVVDEKQRELDAQLAHLHESDAALAAVAEQLGNLSQQVRTAHAEAERLTASLAQASQALESDKASLHDLEGRLELAKSQNSESEEIDDQRAELEAALVAARQVEVDARLALRTGEERQRAAEAQADALERAARDERESRRRFAERKERREREIAIAKAVLHGAEIAISWLEVSLEQATMERTQAETGRVQRDGELTEIRSRLRELSGELERLVSDVHRDEVARAEQRLRIEALENRAMDELGLDADTLVSEFGPDVLVPPTPPAPGDEVDPNAPAPEPYPYVREQQEKRLKQAERGLNLLGKVNPLALEEFAALEERHQFLNAQLDDLRKSKNDLMAIIKDVDERVQQVFAEAFADTAREFEGIFARLFPGGEGRLVLTDPSDLLTTGIEVEARPPGKKLKRLSLLSGGERSLTAVAFLVALFKARPSPFYVMDEVEAALDDVNLGRLIDLMRELQENSQLIVITHQKRTMEIADALYGVTMRGDGISTVISQRLAEARGAE